MIFRVDYYVKDMKQPSPEVTTGIYDNIQVVHRSGLLLLGLHLAWRGRQQLYTGLILAGRL